MPKWGMTMTEGTFIAWTVEEGAEIAVGDEVAEVETEKMLGAVEALAAGRLRRRVANEGDVLPIGAVLGLIAESDVSEAELDAFLEHAETAASEAPEVGQASRDIVVGGSLGDIHALAVGKGRDVVILLHGFSGDALNWRYVLDELAEGGTAIAIDLPGHGDSTKQVGPEPLGELVASVRELMDSEGITRAHLVGHSLGGLVAASLALSEPERVASLALIAPAGFGDAINAEFIDAMVAASSRRELKQVLPKLFADDRLVTRDLVEEMLKYKRVDGVPQALAAISDDLIANGKQRHQIAGSLETLDLPLLVVWGAEDQVLPATQAEAAPDSARVEVLANVGHSPHVEAAGLTALLSEHLNAAADYGPASTGGAG